MPDSSSSSAALAQMSKKLQRIRTAHNHNSAVVTNLRAQLAEAEDLFAQNGDDIQILVKEIERMRRSLDRDSDKMKSEPEKPKQVIDSWLDDVEAAGHAVAATKPNSFSPFATTTQPEPGLYETTDSNETPAVSTSFPGSGVQNEKLPDRSYSQNPTPRRSTYTSNAEHYGHPFRYRSPPPSYAKSPHLEPVKPRRDLRAKCPSPLYPDRDAEAVQARSTSPSPSPQPFTNFTLTTLPDSIHPSFPTVLFINNHWVSVTCAYCGANACSQPGGGRGFLKGLVGLTNHVTQGHGPGAAISRFEGDACLAEILDHCRVAEISERDVKLLNGGSQAVDRPVKRVTLDYELARQKWKMKQAGEGVRREERRDPSLDNERETSWENVASSSKPFSRSTRGIKIRSRGEMHDGERDGGKRKGLFSRGGVEKKLRWGENTIVKIENDAEGEMSDGVGLEDGLELEY
ncbi:hypothetical protein LTR95_016449 [Oleoguttula sp. CCFEE 5521]